ncbi:MAG: dTDP-4-dehydrorhamnose 3,5-epimerase [Candidatus Woesebacteria bacterium GW2011_GWA1_33_30]|uniref:dTDP-4-dehydrorhamnose 3,5-epimerase n=1 Tax=Candidatus Woesebacteria bacterium GW2011_GWA2_33_28 TaxID=1618561 RepID=A0A0G0CAQ6_9BACT|nr:MAG: dTDP-4-dehydrorhamnose 3,5-epimerase [Candidatus Woesebacteria bacterium GW2011_GWA2_33_28]KKP49027.1 MAG: dTDP-4-dehydrorhamnose 3,5-epimerase [Candidatus Woesebacteria bacterium GW2011_GWA1_33_30]KKP49865.1 MAG: dTDP-4-dehydrorhamnose 3,5-epimerase [Microgenomates group bacterium GW2011_GWC1_33_32]KKP52619.1 MAG: dTDP-4-dehydrorhamnose 3,5-epimerase [Candidatus Woesebacteria bacterium GW2011_GWB1_33_38]KKP56671.1 MAG: dTDP-4-dehydrorhamnose 3,5-epimerase [Microgenomates group bacteriu
MMRFDPEKNIVKTGIEGVVLIQRPIMGDARGFLHEPYNKEELKAVTGIEFNPVQWTHAYIKPGVIKAVHSENWNKLVYPVTGILYAPIVDLRSESKTFGKVEYITIDNTKEDSKRQALFLPSGGIGNSICTLGTEMMHYFYLIDEYWDDTKAKGVAWDDPDLNIKWPIKDPILSERDKTNPKLRDLFPEKFS